MKHAKTQYLRIRTAIIVCVILFCCADGYAQSTSSIDGVIMDPNGAVVPGVTVQVQCDCKECPGKPCEECCPSGFSASATSGDDGHFRVEKVPPGVYSVRAEKEGFGAAELHGVEVTASGSRSITLTLGRDNQKASRSQSQTEVAAKEKSAESGRIVLEVMSDETGKPVEKAKVTVRLLCECRIECPDKPCEGCCPSAQVFTTDTSGAVRFNGPIGQYLVSTDYKAYSKDFALTVTPGSTEKVKIELALKDED